MYDLLVSTYTHVEIECNTTNEAQYYSVPQLILYHCQQTGSCLHAALNLRFFTNRSTLAVTRSNEFNLLNLMTSNTVSSLLMDLPLTVNTWVVDGEFFIISLLTASSMVDITSQGHSESGKHRKDGPSHHNTFLSIVSPVKPHDGRSAGFSGPGQCFHCSLEVSCRISLTLLATYCFQGFSFFIQNRTHMESIQ